jgi:hypothetical protein
VTIVCTLPTLPTDGVRTINLVVQAAEPFPPAGLDEGGTVTNLGHGGLAADQLPRGRPRRARVHRDRHAAAPSRS